MTCDTPRGGVRRTQLRPALDKAFGRGTETRTEVMDKAMAAEDKVPEPVLRGAMEFLQPPSRK